MIALFRPTLDSTKVSAIFMLCLLANLAPGTICRTGFCSFARLHQAVAHFARLAFGSVVS